MLGRRALAVLAASILAGCGGVHAVARCSLELRAADGRIKASFSGADGELVLVHEGHVKWRGKGKHVFWLDDYRGADMVMVRATAPDGKVCSAHRTLSENK